MKTLLLLLIPVFLTLKVHSQTEESQIINMIEDTLRANPKNANFLTMKALLLMEKKQFREATHYMSLALANLHQFKVLNPNAMPFPNSKLLDSLDIITGRAYCYNQLNMVDSSLFDYRFIQQRKQKDYFYSIAVVRLYMRHKLYDKAQIEIDQVKNEKDNAERGLVYQAILFYEMEQFDKALTSVDTALQRFPTSIESLITKGKILVKLNRQKEACDYFIKSKENMTPEYFGGEHGYQHDFENEIKSLTAENCK